jgi:hypothetical protein
MPDWHLEDITHQYFYKILTIDRVAFKQPSPFIGSRVFSCWVENPMTIQKPARMRW